jgi:surfactin synthase thioesterase subunit
LDDGAITNTLALIGFTASAALLADDEFRGLLMPMLRGDFEAVANYSQRQRLAVELPVPIRVLGGLRDMFVAPRFLKSWQDYSNQTVKFRIFDDHHYFIESRLQEIVDIIKRTIGEPSDADEAYGAEVSEVSSVEWERIFGDCESGGTLQLTPKVVGVAKNLEHGTLVLLPDILGAPFPVDNRYPLAEGWQVVEFRAEEIYTNAPNSEAIVSALVRTICSFGDAPVILAGHGFGAIMATKVAERLPEIVAHLFVVNAVPPHHYAIPFLDLGTDDDLIGFLRMIQYPGDVGHEDLAKLRARFRLASCIDTSRPTLSCRLTVIRAIESLWFSFHTSMRWRDDVASRGVEFIDIHGDHFAPVDDWLWTRMEAALRGADADLVT